MHIHLKINTLFNWFVITALLVAFYYNAYRYPLQINASSTSPTYSSTPLIMKAAKYIIFSIMYLIILNVKLVSKNGLSLGSKNNYIKFTIALVLSLYPIYWGIVTKSISILETGFFFFITLIMHLFYNQKLNMLRLGKVLEWVVYIALLFNLAQILLFIFIGRLPALAYPNSISVRFGSFLDDPNGFGMLTSLLIGFAYYYFRGKKKLLILASLMLCLLLTQSLTAVAATVGAISLSMLFYILYRFTVGKQILLLSIIVSVIAFSVFITFYEKIIEVFTLFMMLKSGSIEGHAEGINVFSEGSLLNFLGMLPLDMFSEIGYANLITNFGVIYTLLYIAYGGYAIYKYFLITYSNTFENRITKSIAYGSFLFLITFYVAMLNLPLEQVFPINVVGAILLGMANANLIRSSTQIESGPKPIS